MRNNAGALANDGGDSELARRLRAAFAPRPPTLPEALELFFRFRDVRRAGVQGGASGGAHDVAERPARKP
jgi:hypothetical protein